MKDWWCHKEGKVDWAGSEERVWSLVDWNMIILVILWDILAEGFSKQLLQLEKRSVPLILGYRTDSGRGRR